MKYSLENHAHSNRISPTMMEGEGAVAGVKFSIPNESREYLGFLGGFIKRQLLLAAALACVFILTPIVTRADTFNGYQAGNWPAPTLSNSTDCLEGRDYTVTVSNTPESRVILSTADSPVTVSTTPSPVTVLSIHGGGIEAFTSNISAALAKLFGYKLYDFKAQGTTQCLKGSSNTDVLHITATHFDDPRAVSLVGSSSKAVAIHGYADSRGYARGVICVGGADASARSTFITEVNSNASSWGLYVLAPIDAPSAGSGACGDLAGTASTNIVNRTSSGGGLQLEMSTGLRTDLANTSDQSYDALRNIIYGAISVAMETGNGFAAMAGTSRAITCRAKTNCSALRSRFSSKASAISGTGTTAQQETFRITSNITPPNRSSGGREAHCLWFPKYRSPPINA